MTILDDDLAFVLSDTFSSSVTMGTGTSKQTTRGVLGNTDTLREEDGLAVQSRGVLLSIPAGALEGLADDSVLTVDGVAYAVRRAELSLDRRRLDIHLVPQGS